MPGQWDVVEEQPIAAPRAAGDESAFKKWYAGHAARQGLDPNPDAPEHFYDYRSAFAAGAAPDATGHWPSQFKREGHPRMVVDGVNTKTGQPARDPWAVVSQVPRREVSTGEMLTRAGSSALNAANAYAAAPVVGVARILDTLFPGQRFTEQLGEQFVEPSLRRIEQNALHPGEDAGTAGNVALNVAPALGKMAPDLVAGGALTRMAPQAAVKATEWLPAVVEKLRTGMLAGVPAGFRTGGERTQEMLEQGVDPLTAAAQGGATGTMTMGQFALPASAGSAAATLPGRVLSRGAQGAALNATSGASQRAIENAILPAQAAKLAQPVVSPETTSVDMILGALFGQMGGRNPRPASAVRPTVEQPPTAAVPDWAMQRYGAILEANGITDPTDPRAARAVERLQQSEARKAAMVPGLGEDPRVEAAQQAVQAGEMHPAAAPWVGRQGQAEPSTVAVDSQGRAIPLDAEGRPQQPGTIAGFLENYLASQARNDAEARRAFEVAQAQSERKQQAQDAGATEGKPRDLREARAAGSTSKEGTAATAPESFTFLDVQRDARGKPTDTGPQVEIVGETTIKVGNKDVPAYEIAYKRGNEDVREIVQQSRVSTLERPAAPRFAQDIEQTSYAPPKGVGTGPQQPQPRKAAQRITTEASPEFIPGEGSRIGEPPGRAPRNREFEGEVNASTVRSDARQIREGGASGQPDVQRGAGQGRENLQLEAPRQPGGAEQRPAAVDRGEAGQPPAKQPEIDPWEAPSAPRTLEHPEVRDVLEGMANEAGWAEVGGRMVRQKHSEVAGDETISRTKWIPRADWWPGRAGNLNEAQTKEAVRKALAGEPLSKREQAAIDYMVEVANDRLKYDELADVLKPEEDAHYAAEKTGQPADLIRLSEEAERVNPSAFEDLAIRTEGDDAAFRAGLQRIIDDGKASANQSRDQHTSRPAGGEEPPRGDAEGSARGREDAAGVREPNVEGQRADADQGGQAFKLEQPTESGLRERADAERRDAEQRSRVENAPPPEEFTLTGSDRAADVGAAKGQGTLYGGLPLGPMADAVSKAFGWLAGDSKKWAERGAEFKNDIEDLNKGRSAGKGNPAARFASWLLDTSSATMRRMIEKGGNSATAKAVMDHLHDVAGTTEARGESFHNALQAEVNKRMLKLDELLGDLRTDRDAMKQIAALVRNPQNIRPGSKIHDAAKGIRSMLDDTLKYMKEAGVDVGEVKGGYYPREFDIDAVMKNTKQFMDAAAVEYRNMGMSPQQAQMAAKALHDGLLFGDGIDLRTGQHGSSAPFLKERVFGKDVDKPTHPLNEFLLHDPSLTLARYFSKAAKRAEIARRFGDNFSHWKDWEETVNGRTVTHEGIASKIIKEGGTAGMLENLAEYVQLATGVGRPSLGRGAQQASSYMRTWGALMFLEKATLSSLSEFIVPAIRTGNLMDVGRSFRNTIGDLFEGGKLGTASAAERRAFAEDMHAIAGHVSGQLQAARFAGGDPVGRVEGKALDEFFKRTGLTQWTDATRVSAVDIGRTFIRRLAKDMEDEGGKLTKRYLAELGIPTEQAAKFAEFVRSRSDGRPVSAELTGEMGDLYRVAIRRFLSQSIMAPNATTKPSWMSHPVGAVIGQLQSFNYAFYENVLKRNARLAKDAVSAADYTMMERAQMVMPTLMLPMLVGVAYAVGEARDALFGDPERRDKETGTEKALKAASRGAPIAPIDQLINIITSARYNRSFTEAASGPVLGTVGRVADAIRDEFFKNSPNTNTTERRLWKAVWDTFIEPTVNLLLYRVPVAPLSAAVTQAAGAGQVREKLLVEPMAGEKKAAGAGGGKYF